MKKLLLLPLCGLLLPFLSYAQNPADKIDPVLLQRMNATPNEYQEVIIELADQEDAGAMLEAFEAQKTPLETRSYEVITRLQAKAAATQPSVISQLNKLEGADASTIYPVWIVNAIYVKVNANAIQRMAGWPEVGRLSWNAPVELESYISRGQAPVAPNGKEPGLSAIKAPFMWNLGYTGYGRKALVIDSGEDGDHPALIANFWGNEVPRAHAWHGSDYPEDCGDHGTHVTGILCGLDRKTNDTIGVAFNAHWMGAPMQFSIGPNEGCQKAFSQTIFSETSSMQWALNPDGDATTISDQPDVINCSWRSGNFDCNSSVNLLNAVEAAGIAIVCAQGNDGPAASTVTSIASMNIGLVNSFAVGAINGNSASFPIADFSSRGPTPCSGTGSLKIKPEVSAPGVNVRSSVAGGGYMSFDGTSMASPHVAGAVVLLKEAFPGLSGIQIKTALYNTAKDLGVTGEDNAYGMGIIDLQAAYNYLVGQGNTPVSPVAADRDLIIIDTRVDGICKGPVVPRITFENAGLQTITSATILYGVENGTQYTYDWTGSLSPNNFTTVELPAINGITPGSYVFVTELQNPNGMPDSRPLTNRFKRHFVMADADYPAASVTPQQMLPVCSNSRVLLEYTGALGPQEIVQWFINEQGNSLAQGETYLTPPLTQNTTYYVNTADELHTGKPDIPANSNTASIDAALLFDVQKAFILKSVVVYTEETGARLIQVIDNAGTQVAYKLVTITQTGGQRVNLNFKIPVGDDFRITVASGKTLKQTSNQPGYPYTVPGVLNIYGGKTSSGFNTTSVYYYFFDWEIEVPRECGRIPVLVEVSGQSAPTVNFTASADTVYLSAGGNVSFSDQTANAVSWFWDFGNGLTNNTAAPSTTYTQTGMYNVRLIASTANGCSNVAEKTIVVLQTVSAADIADNSEKVLLYPNPVSNEVLLSFPERIPEDLNISVFNLLGQNTWLPNGVNLSSEVVRLDVSALPAGVYIVHLNANSNFRWSGKFVKE